MKQPTNLNDVSYNCVIETVNIGIVLNKMHQLRMYSTMTGTGNEKHV